jgi:hypothetical protein
LALTVHALTAMPRLASESAGKPWPFRADDGRSGAE